MQKTIKTPIRWFGGKSQLVSRILPLIPEHHCYVEAFGGGASVLLAKQPSKVEVYNDVDFDLVNFLRLFHNKTQLKRLVWKCKHHPYSPDVYKEFVENHDKQQDPVERAYQWFSMTRMAFNGLMGATGCSFGSERNYAKQYQDHVDSFGLLSNRIAKVQLENKDWQFILDKYDTAQTLFYLDPPYLPSTRKSGGYVHEMSEDDHEVLVDTLKSVKGKVLISGYDNLLYNSLGWKREAIDWNCSAARHSKNDSFRIEILWYNYEIDRQLTLI